MLMMRLQRIGRKNNPTYRLLVVDRRASTRSNRYVDLLGHYEPKSGKIEINADRAKHWLSQGVKPSDTVYNMLISKKIIEGKKRNVLSRKSPIVKESDSAVADETKTEVVKETEGAEVTETPKTEVENETTTNEGEPKTEEAVVA
jgi:small subunit ribosomal protein S16